MNKRGRLFRLFKEQITIALLKHDGNRTRSARYLGISIRGMRMHIRELDIKIPAPGKEGFSSDELRELVEMHFGNTPERAEKLYNNIRFCRERFE